MSSYSGDRSSQRPTTTTSSSFDSYHFDFGLSAGARSSSSRPLRDQKPSSSAASPSPSPWTHRTSKPSWTHQPSPAAAIPVAAGSVPTSMVGDIMGKSWSSSAPSKPSSGLGIPQSNNPSLFSDLVGSALGGAGRAPSNAPLKSAASRPAAATGAFSMSNMANSLPKSAAPMASGTGIGGGIGNRPVKPAGMASAAAAQPIGQKRDPFGSIDPFASKPAAMNAAKQTNTVNSDPGFGAFPGANSGADHGFGGFQSATSAKLDGFGVKGPSFTPPPDPEPAPAAVPVKSGVDPLDMLFSSPAAAPATAAAGNGGEMFGELNDWDVGAEFGGGEGGGPTTELEGLPPPPAGLTVSAAKSKGMDNYKGGQYADAIKWLSWAVVLMEKTRDDAAIVEVLSSRASSYKEVGEYKKAIADCSKVLEQDKENVSVLLQRALLYESSEKYRLGAEDLRMVLKIDPGNRLARSTIHRLNKMAD